MLRKLIFASLMLFGGAVFSQKNLEKGDKLFDLNLFVEAIHYYDLEVKAKNHKTVDIALLKLADCYRITGEFEKAEATYKILLKKKKKDPKAVLNYAISLKSSAKYAEAAVQFSDYLKLNPSDPMGEMYLQSCDLAQRWLDETIGKEVRNVEKLNSGAADFAPVLVDPGTLLYSSSREGSTQALVSFDGGNEINRLDLYDVDVNSLENNASLGITGLKPINSPLHEGPATFSKDGTELFFTRTIQGKKNKETNERLNPLQVFYSKKDSTGKWSRPKSAFSFNSTEYSVGQPSLSADGRTIFYMSDMPGGKGGTDIYYSTRNSDNTWSAPKRVEGNVNTFGHELFPYISETGILYFSSDVHPGMGQLDIFSATNNNGKWSNVTNLKPPINSIANDFGIALDGKYMRGFFSSDRFNGKGAEDIYSFSDPTPLKLTVNGNHIEFADKSMYDGIRYKLVNEKTKEEINLEPRDGIYDISVNEFNNYTLVAKKNGFSYNKIKINLNRDTLGNYLEVKLRSSLREILVDGFLKVRSHPDSARNGKAELSRGGVTVQLMDSTTTVEKTVTGKDGYFGYEHKIYPNANYTLLAKINIQKDPPDPIIVCKGMVIYMDNPIAKSNVQLLENDRLIENYQTGDKGSFSFELDLGKKYTLIAGKQGFESRSVSFNTEAGDIRNGIYKVINLDSLGSIGLRGITRNSKSGLGNVQVVIREKNNIIGEIRSRDEGKFDFSLLPDRQYVVTATAAGYLQKEVIIDTKQVLRGGFVNADLLMDSIQLNSVIELKNLYYDYDKPDVQFTSLPVLDKLIEFMRANPTVKIELAANTDSRGNADYNQKLSQARAQNAKDYLTLEEVSPDRVIPVGYGKNRPIIPNAKTEEEHQVNRRTEIKILQK